MAIDLKKKTFVITGASSGIGYATAEMLASHDANIMLSNRDSQRLEKTYQVLKEQYPEAAIARQQADVTDADQVQRMVDAALDQWGEIYGLINNAGVMYYNYMDHLNLNEWIQTVDINCKGPLHTIAATLPALKKSQGHIVNITSDASRFAFDGLAVYSGSKAFLEYLSRSMRRELVKYKIRVTTLQPGNVDTNLFSLTSDKDALTEFGPQPEQLLLKPENVASAIEYALTQPEHVAVNEILVEPADQPI